MANMFDESWNRKVAPGVEGNTNEKNRWMQLAGGTALLVLGFKSRGLAQVGLMAFGGGLLYMAATGRNPMGRQMALRSNTGSDIAPNAVTSSVNVNVPQQQGQHVTVSITINKPAAELYGYWRNFKNLPRIMNHLESVTPLDGNRSHWKAKAPLGMTVEWDAEIFNEIPNELIAWRSLADAQIPNAGSVRFKSLPYARGTEIKVELEYMPPAGKVGVVIARLLGEEPQVQIEGDLRRFKQLMEAGEIATTEGQSSGRGNRS